MKVTDVVFGGSLRLKNAISNHSVMPYVAPPPVQPPLHPDQKDIQDILDKL